MTSTPSGPDRFRLLLVCTGGICRSPLAEQLFRRDFAARSDVVFASAGLEAMAGTPMDDRSADISRRLGGDPRGAVGKGINAPVVGGADLILVMTQDQLQDLTRRYPPATRKAFTLLQLVGILAGMSATEPSAQTAPDRLRSLVEAASRQRYLAGAGPFDIADPYRRDDELNEQVGAVIHDAVRAVSHRLMLEIGQAPSTLG